MAKRHWVRLEPGEYDLIDENGTVLASVHRESANRYRWSIEVGPQTDAHGFPIVHDGLTDLLDTAKRRAEEVDRG